jgi:hypothetical protein
MKTLVITLNNGTTKKVEIPDDSRVTYGQICPGTKSRGFEESGNSYGLRVYGKNKEDQLACFTGIKEWRVDTIKVLKKDIKKASKNIMVNEDGVEKMQRVTATTEKWVDEDEEGTDDAPAAQAFIGIKQLQNESNDF